MVVNAEASPLSPYVIPVPRRTQARIPAQKHLVSIEKMVIIRPMECIAQLWTRDISEFGTRANETVNK
jgi:hypothetical protein